jgi:hypothetical protein
MVHGENLHRNIEFVRLIDHEARIARLERALVAADEMREALKVVLRYAVHPAPRDSAAGCFAAFDIAREESKR